MIKGAIFDLDGVIIDTMPLWNNLAKIYLESKGIIPEKNLNKKIEKMSLDESSYYFKTKYNINLSTSEIKAEIIFLLEKNYIYNTPLKKGVEKLIKKFYENDVKMIITTASDKKISEKSLYQNNISKYFEKIITCTDVGANKENLKIYKKSLEYLKLEKNEVVIIEDALHAIKTCKNDDFFVIGVKDDSEKNQKKIKELSDIYLEDYSDLTVIDKLLLH